LSPPKKIHHFFEAEREFSSNASAIQYDADFWGGFPPHGFPPPFLQFGNLERGKKIEKEAFLNSDFLSFQKQKKRNHLPSILS
jgi:hypothetical protein